MKKVKYFLWLIILIAFVILIYQNIDYFMAVQALKFDLKVFSWNWTIPEIQNIAFFAICFLTGFILAGIKWLMANLKFKKEIKAQNLTIDSLKEQLNSLKSELDVFQHDPYIKKEIEETKEEENSIEENVEQGTSIKGDKQKTED